MASRQSQIAALDAADVVRRALAVEEDADIVRALGAALGSPSPSAAGEPGDGGDDDASLAAFKERIQRSQLITPRAKDLAQGALQLEPVLRIVLTDKRARTILRDEFDVRGPDLRFRGPGSGPQTGGPAPRALDTMTFGEACEAYGVRFTALDLSTRRIGYRHDGRRVVIRLYDLPQLLADEARADEAEHVFQALVRYGNQFLILLLFAAWQTGRVQVSDAFTTRFRMACIRSLLAQNAVETAYQEAIALRDDPGTQASPPRHRARLDELVARAAIRSGRAETLLDPLLARFTQAPALDSFRPLLTIATVLRPDLAVALCQAALEGAIDLAPQDRVTIAEVLRLHASAAESFAVAQGLLATGRPHLDGYLGLANAALDLGEDAMWRAAVERYFAAQDLAIHQLPSHAPRPFSFHGGDAPRTREHPLVSVIVTTFESVATLEHSLASVQAQTCANLEILVVDDASGDDTPQLIRRLAARDDRIVPLFKDTNEGTYVAKNHALRQATGEFITFHDADDWMHPQRIARHLEAMTEGTACTTSHWIRMDVDGIVSIRRGGFVGHLNPASTFFHHSVFDAVGYFDAVRTGADSELLGRVRAALGGGAVTGLTDCLGIGLHHEASLTRAGVSAFDAFRYSAVRVAYWESWLRWHVIRAADERVLYNPGDLDLPYALPEGLQP